jgi:hypothetical protein
MSLIRRADRVDESADPAHRAHIARQSQSAAVGLMVASSATRIASKGARCRIGQANAMGTIAPAIKDGNRINPGTIGEPRSREFPPPIRKHSFARISRGTALVSESGMVTPQLV